MVSYNEIPTTYEAYNGITYPINLPSGMELCKIGTYQDYFYKENDKWYLHKEIGKVVLNGSENYNFPNNVLQSSDMLPNDIKNIDDTLNAYSNYFTYKYYMDYLKFHHHLSKQVSLSTLLQV